jgi:protocatechuate 3,4-dioxygenase beta subunit
VPAATLDGRVVEDHSGNPLASIEVKVYRTGQKTLAAHLETDGSGRFHAENLPDGEYRIDASKPNYIGSSMEMKGVGSDVQIRLVHCGVISGQVLDGQGHPVLGASVYVLVKSAGDTPPRLLRTNGRAADYSMERVDERGRYRMHGLPPGEYAVAVTYGASTAMFGMSGGAEPSSIGSGVQLYPTNQRPQFFPVTGGEQYPNIDFAVLPSTLHSIKGSVKLPDPKSRYWLALIAADQPSIATAVAETDRDGSFSFEGVASGVYTLVASGPIRGYGGKGVVDRPPYFARMPVNVAMDVEGVAVSVQPARAVPFVLRPSGPGCPSTAQIRVRAIEDFAVHLDKSGDINAEKETPIPDLAPARCQVFASNLGESCFQPSIPLLDLSGGLPGAPVAVPVTSVGAIQGKLAGATDPTKFSVALIAAEPDSGSPPVRVVLPDSTGRFSFGGLRPGRYRLAVQGAGEASKGRWVTDPKRMIEFQIPAGAPTEIELPAPKGGAQ